MIKRKCFLDSVCLWKSWFRLPVLLNSSLRVQTSFSTVETYHDSQRAVADRISGSVDRVAVCVLAELLGELVEFLGELAEFLGELTEFLGELGWTGPNFANNCAN